MAVERIDTVVIGGGQAGLTMSHCLSSRGLRHIVLERHRVAERWRSERWDSLRFQFPNWAMRLPDFAYNGNDPDGFAPRDEVVRFIEAYASFIQAPVRTGVEVRSVRREAGAFRVDLGDAALEAKNVVIATGPYQRPAIPACADGLGLVMQIPASAYRNPDALPRGGVLVVGSGASGCQIAEELLRAGRRVVLSVGAHRRVPRRYRGRDFIWWISALGLDDRIADEGAVRQAPLLISGANGGHTVDLRRFAADGMVLAGRFQGAAHGVASFAADLAASLTGGDESYAAFVRTADLYADPTLPDQTDPEVAYPEPVGIETLDLRAGGIGAVIWATGYRYDFGWVDLDVFGPTGVPIHRRGVTNVPGAYFLGLPFLHKSKSSFLSGVGDDAAYLADQIEVRGGFTNVR